MTPLVTEARATSVALFGNEKFADVVVALADAKGAATAQHIARATEFSHGLVRDVLRRCADGGIVRELPRTGGSRSPLYYEPIGGNLWTATLRLARAVQETSRQG